MPRFKEEEQPAAAPEVEAPTLAAVPEVETPASAEPGFEESGKAAEGDEWLVDVPTTPMKAKQSQPKKKKKNKKKNKAKGKEGEGVVVGLGATSDDPVVLNSPTAHATEVIAD